MLRRIIFSLFAHGSTFGDVPLNMELKLEVVDRPNAVGGIIDTASCAKVVLDRGLSGTIDRKDCVWERVNRSEKHRRSQEGGLRKKVRSLA